MYTWTYVRQSLRVGASIIWCSFIDLGRMEDWAGLATPGDQKIVVKLEK